METTGKMTAVSTGEAPSSPSYRACRCDAVCRRAFLRMTRLFNSRVAVTYSATPERHASNINETNVATSGRSAPAECPFHHG